MNLESLLTSTNVSKWIVEQAVVFDWYDGPRKGVCALKTPLCEFAYDIVAERWNPDGLDDRLLRLRELPTGSVQRILTLISELGMPSATVWVPIWQFESEVARQTADATIDKILHFARQTNILLWTRDMKRFLGVWNVSDIEETETRNWFTVLEI